MKEFKNEEHVSFEKAPKKDSLVLRPGGIKRYE